MPFVQHEDKDVVPLWIDGGAKAHDSSRIFPITSASRSKTVHYAASASPSDAREAADAAWIAFTSWRHSKYNERRDLLLRVADLYTQRADELAHWQVVETSCSEEYARFNIKLAIDMTREFAGTIVEATTGATPPIQADGVALVFKDPVGPVLLIPPWNSSIILSTRGVGAAIAAGCTVVMKASEACPRTHSMVVEIFEQAGLPKGCLNQVQTKREDAPAVTEALISHKAIRKIEFIGSASVGRIIGQVAAKHLKPVLMELGGKGPALVLKDADIARAVQLCAFGAFLHHGQICFSTERIIVEKPVADAFIELLKKEVNSHYSSVSSAVDIGGAEHARIMVQKALDNGARVLVGDNTFTNDNHTSVRPTIITDVNPSHEIYDQEAFGPSASLYVVENEAEAVKLANESSYGLSATIHTVDYMKALTMARELDYGQVHVNTTTVYDQSTMPVSGVKGSGWGNNNGAYGIQEFLVDKAITLHRPDEQLAFGKA